MYAGPCVCDVEVAEAEEEGEGCAVEEVLEARNEETGVYWVNGGC